MTLAIGDKAGHSTGRNQPSTAKIGADNLIVQQRNSARSVADNGRNLVGAPQSDQDSAQDALAPPLRVLIVEDDLTIGPLLAEVLVDLGHVVCAIETDANAAAASARRYRPDLMIVDVRLGTTSGLSAVKEILEQGFVPHVFVTGDAVRSLPLGPEAVLIQKPYRPSDLVTAIAKASARRSTLEQPS